MFLSGLRAKHRFLRRHPGYRPLRTEVRLLVWRARSLTGRPATVTFPRSGIRMRLPAEWRGMSKMAYVFRDDAERELAALHQFVPEGAVAVDVGAHYGDYALVLATLVGRAGSVLALEPSRSARRVLADNVHLNDAAQILIEPFAAGAVSETAELHHHPDPSRASLGEMGPAGTGSEPVEVRTLDEILDRHGIVRLDFVKIDVEGAELDVLVGARRSIERFRPVIMFEYQELAAERLGHDPLDAWRYLESLGYSIRALDRADRLVPATVGTDLGPNFLAIHDLRGT